MSNLFYRGGGGPICLFKMKLRKVIWAGSFFPGGRVHLLILKKNLFVAFPWVETSTGPGGSMICVFII